MSTVIEGGVHHVLGGSSVDRWTNCAPSVQLGYKLGVTGGGSGPSEYAFEGTVAHYVCERCLLDNVEPWEFVGETFTSAENPELEVTVTSEMTSAVWEFVAYCRATAKYYEDCGYSVEANVEAKTEGGHVKIGKTRITAGGTVDFGIVATMPGETVVHVVDYKHGAGIWVPADASQLKTYAVWMVDPGWLPSEKNIYYRTSVVQPRADNPSAGGQTVRSAEFSRDDMVAHRAVLEAGKQAIKDPLASYNPGPWCKYCPVKLACPAIFSPVAKANEEGEPRELSNEALGEWLALKDQLRQFAKDLEDAAFNKLSQGEDVPGYKLVDRYGNRAWSDGAFDALAKVVDTEKLYEQKPRSPAQVEKMGKDVKSIVQEYSHQPYKGLTVTPADDSREGVKPRTAADAFSDVAQN